MARRWRRWILALGLLGAGCAAPAPPAPLETGLAPPVETGQLVLWRATGAAGQRLHLLGTLHLGRTQTGFDPAIGEALAHSDVLALELRLSDLEPSATLNAFARIGVLHGSTVFEQISPETGSLLRDWLAANGMDEMAVRNVKPWAAWLMVVSTAFSGGGLRFEHGVESSLANEEAPELPVVGLETLEDQLGVLDALSAEVQEAMLTETLTAALASSGAAGARADGTSDNPITAEADRMIDAWQKGDLDWIQRLVLAEATHDFADLLIVGRNHNMADRIEDLVAEGHRPFVAVGAAHMVGAQGLPSLLGARGYRVERIPKTPAALPEHDEKDETVPHPTPGEE